MSAGRCSPGMRCLVLVACLVIYAVSESGQELSASGVQKVLLESSKTHSGSNSGSDSFVPPDAVAQEQHAGQAVRGQHSLSTARGLQAIGETIGRVPRRRRRRLKAPLRRRRKRSSRRRHPSRYRLFKDPKPNKKLIRLGRMPYTGDIDGQALLLGVYQESQHFPEMTVLAFDRGVEPSCTSPPTCCRVVRKGNREETALSVSFKGKYPVQEAMQQQLTKVLLDPPEPKCWTCARPPVCDEKCSSNNYLPGKRDWKAFVKQPPKRLPWQRHCAVRVRASRAAAVHPSPDKVEMMPTAHAGTCAAQCIKQCATRGYAFAARRYLHRDWVCVCGNHAANRSQLHYFDTNESELLKKCGVFAQGHGLERVASALMDKSGAGLFGSLPNQRLDKGNMCEWPLSKYLRDGLPLKTKAFLKDCQAFWTKFLRLDQRKVLWKTPLKFETGTVSRQCDGSTLPIACPESKVLKIKAAKYGRASPTEFAHGCGGMYESNQKNCPATKSLDVLKSIRASCQGRRECSLGVCPNLFKAVRLCPGIPKYLEVHHQCVDPRTAISNSTTNTSQPLQTRPVHFEPQTAFAVPIWAAIPNRTLGSDLVSCCNRKCKRKPIDRPCPEGLTIARKARRKGRFVECCVDLASCHQKPHPGTRTCDSGVAAHHCAVAPKTVGFGVLKRDLRRARARALRWHGFADAMGKVQFPDGGAQAACVKTPCIKLEDKRAEVSCASDLARVVAIHVNGTQQGDNPARIGDGDVTTYTRSEAGSPIEFRYSRSMDFDHVRFFWAPNSRARAQETAAYTFTIECFHKSGWVPVYKYPHFDTCRMKFCKEQNGKALDSENIPCDHSCSRCACQQHHKYKHRSGWKKFDFKKGVARKGEKLKPWETAFSKCPEPSARWRISHPKYFPGLTKHRYIRTFEVLFGGGKGAMGEIAQRSLPRLGGKCGFDMFRDKGKDVITWGDCDESIGNKVLRCSGIVQHSVVPSSKECENLIDHDVGTFTSFSHHGSLRYDTKGALPIKKIWLYRHSLLHPESMLDTFQVECARGLGHQHSFRGQKGRVNRTPKHKDWSQPMWTQDLSFQSDATRIKGLEFGWFSFNLKTDCSSGSLYLKKMTSKRSRKNSAKADILIPEILFTPARFETAELPKNVNNKIMKYWCTRHQTLRLPKSSPQAFPPYQKVLLKEFVPTMAGVPCGSVVLLDAHMKMKGCCRFYSVSPRLAIKLWHKKERVGVWSHTFSSVPNAQWPKNASEKEKEEAFRMLPFTVLGTGFARAHDLIRSNQTIQISVQAVGATPYAKDKVLIKEKGSLELDWWFKTPNPLTPCPTGGKEYT